MFVVLLVLGILVTGAGLVAVGFGIKFNELDVGATLIIAGSSVLSGGLVLIGLGLAVRELTRILDAVRPRAGVRSSRPVEAIEPVMPAPIVAAPPPTPPAARPVPAKAPAAPKAEAPPAPVARPDANLDVSASAIERLRSSLPRPERVVPETEGVPLSPNGNGQHAPDPMPEPPRPVAAEPPPPPPAPQVRPVEAPARAAVATAETLREKEPRLDFLFRSKPRASSGESFDSVWPKRPRASDTARTATAEAVPHAEVRQVETRQVETRQVENRQAEARQVETRQVETRNGVPAAVVSDDQRALAILKSGVVDGMAYTLYADGSIEAQLPGGTVRFGSIAELRAHIENNS